MPWNTEENNGEGNNNHRITTENQENDENGSIEREDSNELNISINVNENSNKQLNDNSKHQIANILTNLTNVDIDENDQEGDGP